MLFVAYAAFVYLDEAGGQGLFELVKAFFQQEAFTACGVGVGFAVRNGDALDIAGA